MKKTAKLFKLLGDETRIKILLSIMKKEKNVLEIVKEVKKSQPVVSIHLNRMEREGLLDSERVGRMIFYRLKNQKIAELIKIAEAVSNE
ncbi:MAG: metalloregulator ArsR/SmtB family transcription factor [Candidatus Aenigmarchaeota archaeon]|nr:metalloregulator ArsR/SmtB family transcription factor [Candidatus Aenigmarchaeota archaeon]